MDRRGKHNHNGSALANTALGVTLTLGLGAGGATPVLAEEPDRPTHEVQRGETLYSIVQTFDLPSGVSVNEAMLAFLEANPDAFAEQNVNTLRAGTVLQMPPDAAFAGRDQDSARAEVLRHIENWDPGAVRVEDRFEAVDEGREGMSRAAIEERLASRDAEIDGLREAVEELRFLLESERLDAGTDAAAEELREQMEQDLATLRTERDHLRERLVEVEERLVEVESRPDPDEMPLTEQLTRPPVLVALGSMALGLGLFLVAGVMLGRRWTGGRGQSASGGKNRSANAESVQDRTARGDEAEPPVSAAEDRSGAAAAAAVGVAGAAAASAASAEPEPEPEPEPGADPGSDEPPAFDDASDETEIPQASEPESEPEPEPEPGADPGSDEPPAFDDASDETEIPQASEEEEDDWDFDFPDPDDESR